MKKAKVHIKTCSLVELKHLKKYVEKQILKNEKATERVKIIDTVARDGCAISRDYHEIPSMCEMTVPYYVTLACFDKDDKSDAKIDGPWKDQGSSGARTGENQGLSAAKTGEKTESDQILILTDDGEKWDQIIGDFEPNGTEKWKDCDDWDYGDWDEGATGKGEIRLWFYFMHQPRPVDGTVKKCILNGKFGTLKVSGNKCLFDGVEFGRLRSWGDFMIYIL